MRNKKQQIHTVTDEADEVSKRSSVSGVMDNVNGLAKCVIAATGDANDHVNSINSDMTNAVGDIGTDENKSINHTSNMKDVIVANVAKDDRGQADEIGWHCLIKIISGEHKFKQGRLRKSVHGESLENGTLYELDLIEANMWGELELGKQVSLDGESLEYGEGAGGMITALELEPDGASFIGACFDKTDFKGFKFGANIRFELASFAEDANFRNASFAGNACFMMASFAGGACFSKASFTGHANFGEVSFTGNANFMEAAFTRQADFKMASFAGVPPSQGACFSKASFTGGADFREASFTGNANFMEAAFTGQTDFNKASFTGKANFGKASFTGEANFVKASFAGDVDFNTASFTGDVRFDKASFAGDTNFREASFPGGANFTEASFAGKAYFTRASFTGGASFEAVVFTAHMKFKNAKFAGSLNLKNAQILSSKVKNLDDTFAGATISSDLYLWGAKVVNRSFTGALMKDASIHDLDRIAYNGSTGDAGQWLPSPYPTELGRLAENEKKSRGLCMQLGYLICQTVLGGGSGKNNGDDDDDDDSGDDNDDEDDTDSSTDVVEAVELPQVHCVWIADLRLIAYLGMLCQCKDQVAVSVREELHALLTLLRAQMDVQKQLLKAHTANAKGAVESSAARAGNDTKDVAIASEKNRRWRNLIGAGREAVEMAKALTQQTVPTIQIQKRRTNNQYQVAPVDDVHVLDLAAHLSELYETGAELVAKIVGLLEGGEDKQTKGSASVSDLVEEAQRLGQDARAKLKESGKAVEERLKEFITTMIAGFSDCFKESLMKLKQRLSNVAKHHAHKMLDDGFTRLHTYPWWQRLWKTVMHFDTLELNKHVDEIEQVLN
jgi:hypothetical protein